MEEEEGTKDHRKKKHLKTLSDLVPMEVECWTDSLKENCTGKWYRAVIINTKGCSMNSVCCLGDLKNRYRTGRTEAERRRRDFYLIGEQNKV